MHKKIHNNNINACQIMDNIVECLLSFIKRDGRLWNMKS